jgi:hypothetical protein
VEFGVRVALGATRCSFCVRLTFVENRIEVIDRQLKEVQPEPPKVSTDRVREFVLQKASELETILQGDRAAA